MKYIITFLLSALLLPVFSQVEQIEQFYVDQLAYDQVYFQCSFGNNDLTTVKNLEELRFQVVTEVALLYTQFKSSESFDQNALNEERKEALKSAWPELFEQELIHWRYLEQTGASSKAEAELLPHGYVITYRKKAGEELTELELKELENLVGEGKGRLAIESEVLIDGISCAHETYQEAEYPDGYVAFGNLISQSATVSNMRKQYAASISFVVDPKGRIIDLTIDGEQRIVDYIKKDIAKAELWEPALRNGVPESSRVEINWRYNHNDNEIYIDFLDGTSHDWAEALAGKANSRLSAVSSVFNRNNWSNMAVVVDVTGSMYPYSADFILWASLAENMGSISSVSAFNDGDKTWDKRKVMGEVGGIYSRKVSHFEDVKDVIAQAMRNGNGGDLPENNIEALIHTQNTFSEFNELVLIADNFATPRDLQLLSEVKVPIRLILCGAFGGVNPDYLTLIRENGGSIHTIEKDINDLTKLQEGTEIMLAGCAYVIKDGKFIPSPKV